MYNGNCQKCASAEVCVFDFSNARCLPGDGAGDACRGAAHFA